MHRTIPFLAILTFLAAPTLAQQTFRDSAKFLAALNGGSVTTEGFENTPFGTIIPDGSEFGGLTWQFNLTGPAEGGLIANTYAVIESQGLFVERDGAPGAGPNDYFYLPESVMVTFPKPVTAVGVFFNVGVGDTPDYAYLKTGAGVAFTGGPVNEESVYPYMFFAGFISDEPFTVAAFGCQDFAPTGWNADNFIYGDAAGTGCYPDFDGDGELTLFDFLGYVNAFNAGAGAAECDGDNELTLFDFLCYVNAFNAGC